MAGVEIGVVRSVREQPGNQTCPVNLGLDISRSKDNPLPRDARVRVSSEGVLGPTYLEIVSAGASGPPIESGGVLLAVPTAEMTPQAENKLVDAIKTAFDRAEAPCFASEGRCVIHLESLDYPPLARQAMISGAVKVRAHIEKDGAVVAVLSDGPRILKEAAALNLTLWRFTAGPPREIEVTYVFRLEEPKVAYEPKSKIAFDLPDKVTITSQGSVAQLVGAKQEVPH
jgi:hypothetical protein